MVRVFELIVQLAWPTLLAVLVYYFRTPILAILVAIPEALRRVQSVDAFGVKASMQQREQNVIETTAQAVVDAEMQAPASTAAAELTVVTAHQNVADSPPIDRRARIVELSAQIEREVRILAEARGLPERNMPLALLLTHVSAMSFKGEVPSSLIVSLQAFMGLRNEVVHRWESADVSVEAVESGVEILGLLKKIPRVLSTVIAAPLPIFSDPECKKAYDDIHGVLVENRGPDGIPAIPVSIRRLVPIKQEIKFD